MNSGEIESDHDPGKCDEQTTLHQMACILSGPGNPVVGRPGWHVNGGSAPLICFLRVTYKFYIVLQSAI